MSAITAPPADITPRETPKQPASALRRFSAGVRRRILLATTVLVVLAGTRIRVDRWANNRSLWLDEEFIAVNVGDHGFLRLAGTLDFG